MIIYVYYTYRVRPLYLVRFFSPKECPIFYGWIILPVASLAMFISGPGQTYSFSVFIDPMRQALGLTQTEIATIYTAGSLTASVMLILMGMVLDRIGARVMLAIIGILFGLASFWMAQVSNTLELFVGFTFMRLLGQGTLGLIATTLVAVWFIRLRGRVTSMVSLGGAISQGIFPPLIVGLIAAFEWRMTWAILGFIILITLVLPALLLVRKSPESTGLLPDGDRNIPDAADASADRNRKDKEVNYSPQEVLRTHTFWFLLIATSSNSLVSTALTFNNNSFFASKGLDNTVAASIFPAMAIMVLIGNVVAGFLSDKYPNRYLLAMAQFNLALPLIWSFVIVSQSHALIYGALLGFAGGFAMTTGVVIFANYYGRQYLGSIRGITTTASVGAAALGPMPFAFLFDLTGGYTVPMQVFLILPALCVFCALAAKPPQKGDKPLTAVSCD